MLLAQPLEMKTIYLGWYKEHPSAISSFQQMINASKGKQIVVFLDYDGTLSPIVCDPDRAFMSDQMRAAVQDVSKHFPTAIISGRSREKVYSFVKLNEVYYSGSHGMDTMGPAQKNHSYDDKYHYKTVDEEGNEFIVFQPAKDFLPAIKKMLVEMMERTKNIRGVVIEDNMFCLSVHYRHVKDDEDYERLEQEVKSMLVNYPEFHLTSGKKVLEIRPSIEWNKGHALEYLINNLGFDNSKTLLPIYIGDDTTDEDAFRVLRERGEGYPIVVSSKPTKTMAFHSLHDPSEVLSFLIRLGRWGGSNSNQG
ncbi:putative trehalose-phosphatase [Helianthus annuus]|uniref:Trehalose 6-phosphate phosphatase n=2 Tax=Helianthus annuus TaxID=4232 RepID=A0A251SN27_HELAN|nr:putative trehalose-phosphatase [Helianthus annuus]KAJ0466283.1 putative trehalose-phosphatase [Helianthus annuus]KAJ0471295.1 putative trehalose-phosphatase [Helianthus annuus]KAJ0487844.1 putative trehalose-phosphatase [Helianthus annuus]KAJ0661977.1 putative trehalose-phosphatase [Helianthus annuus]